MHPLKDRKCPTEADLRPNSVLSIRPDVDLRMHMDWKTAEPQEQNLP